MFQVSNKIASITAHVILWSPWFLNDMGKLQSPAVKFSGKHLNVGVLWPSPLIFLFKVSCSTVVCFYEEVVAMDGLVELTLRSATRGCGEKMCACELDCFTTRMCHCMMCWPSFHMCPCSVF